MKATIREMELYSKLLLYALVLFVAAGCSDELESADDSHTDELTCSVTLPSIPTKGLVTGTSLPDGSTIGVWLTDHPGASDATYQKSSFTASSGESGQVWNDVGTPILLTNTASTAYSYFPYRESVDDITAIPVRMEDQIDLLVADKVTDITRTNRAAHFKMKHVLSAVRLRLTIGDYFGLGKLHSYSIQGEHFAAQAKVDATTGSLYDFKEAVDPYLISLENPIQLSDEPTELDVIVIPEQSTGKIILELQVDEQSFKAELQSTELVAGKINSYAMMLRPQSVSISPVEVTEWEYPAAVSGTMMSGYAVQMIGDLSNVALHMAEATDTRMVIKACPLNNIDLVNEVTIGGSGTFQQDIDQNSGIRTITLENISSDIQITFKATSRYFVRYMGNRDNVNYGTIPTGRSTRTLYIKPLETSEIALPPVVANATVDQIRYEGMDCLVDLSGINSEVSVTLQGTRPRTECLTVSGNRTGLTHAVSCATDGALVLRITPDDPNNVARIGSLTGEGEILRNRYLANGQLEVLICPHGDCTYALDGTDTPVTQAWSAVSDDGIYYVAPNGLATPNPSSACLGVALVNQATGQRFIIEKFENTGDGYLTAAAGKANYMFRWKRVASDLAGTNQAYALGTTANGYLGGSSTPQLSTNPSTWTSGALGNFDGATNTNALVALSEAEDNDYTITLATVVRAMRSSEWGMGYTDWMIPATGQLGLMLLHLDEINTKLTDIGGTPIQKQSYWSSTEKDKNNVYIVAFNTNRVVTDNKSYVARCRLIRTF